MPRFSALKNIHANRVRPKVITIETSSFNDGKKFPLRNNIEVIAVGFKNYGRHYVQCIQKTPNNKMSSLHHARNHSPGI
jgi:hypothetical protein